MTAQPRKPPSLPFRIGFGYDIHKLIEGRKLILAGVDFPSPVGCLAHSDGDVLIHAVIDALLGAAALGDIGQHFPPDDPVWKDVSSKKLLRQVCDLLSKHGYRVHNVDSTIILEKPKLLPFKEKMRENLSGTMHVPLHSISIKGKTKEQCDAAGAGEAIEAYAVVLITEAGGPPR